MSNFGTSLSLVDKNKVNIIRDNQQHLNLSKWVKQSELRNKTLAEVPSTETGQVDLRSYTVRTIIYTCKMTFESDRF